MKVTPVLLVILDGFGHREECDDNAICQARKPHWNFFWKTLDRKSTRLNSSHT